MRVIRGRESRRAGRERILISGLRKGIPEARAKCRCCGEWQRERKKEDKQIDETRGALFVPLRAPALWLYGENRSRAEIAYVYAGHFSSGNSLLAGEVELLACGFMIVSGDPLWVLCILILSVYVNSLHPYDFFCKSTNFRNGNFFFTIYLKINLKKHSSNNNTKKA